MDCLIAQQREGRTMRQPTSYDTRCVIRSRHRVDSVNSANTINSSGDTLKNADPKLDCFFIFLKIFLVLVIEHEDIRHSLEVLDNVLAEFDDCLESLDGSSSLDFKRSSDPSSELHRNFQSDDISPNGSKCYDNVSLDDKLFCFNNSRGGSTSHNSSNAVQEQPKVGSPPPIPKRSPNTRLSEQMLSPFTFPSDDTSLDSYDSNRSDSAVHCDGLSEHAQISSLSQLQKNGDTTLGECRSIAKNTYDADKCANCGRELKRTARAMESSEDAKVSSPFQQRKEMFEAKIAEGLSNTPIPKGVNRSYGSSFRMRKTTPEHVDTSSEPVSLPADLSKSIDSASQLSKESLSYVTVSGDERDQSVSFSHHSVNCTCKAKIQKLDAKFSETKRLLRLNSINGLDSKPPSFVPPPPPVINGVGGKLERTSVLQLVTEEASRSKILRMDGNNSGLLRVKDSLQDSEVDSFYSVDNTKESFQSANSRLEKCLDLNKTDSPKLCNRCSSCLSTCLSTIEDLPNLLPTDALNRPHLGLSYSMEDDFFVETKEIQQTSTPKSDASSLSMFKTKESSLSTFSHSASSLGYVSSQSDLELNNLPPVPDKVPVSTFKSRTLPNGLDLSPFYSPIDTEQSPHSGEGKDHNGNRCVKTVHVSHEDLLQLRSSSAPCPQRPRSPRRSTFVSAGRTKKTRRKMVSHDLKKSGIYETSLVGLILAETVL
ncbi:uncharacterized protein CEXT_281751 [Caerostris extrusa]|uniref:Uncharacterized protein n=1 Tax=Caerostris extrusa TaxID=172846 RepID=A0AAV4XPV7_CAEEX|nr:uncharacterized protein CEXT_281751 [Caerostris extrusa]